MSKGDTHVEIVWSKDPSLGPVSMASYKCIKKSLSKHYRSVGTTIIDTKGDLSKLIHNKPDVAFLCTRFVPSGASHAQRTSKKIWLARYLSAHQIPFTSSTSDAISLEYYKPATKQVIKKAGLPTPPFIVAPIGAKYNSQAALPISLPAIIKPSNHGTNLATDVNAVVVDFPTFTNKVAALTTSTQASVLVEEYLPGREFYVAIIEHHSSTKLMGCAIEVIHQSNNDGVSVYEPAQNSSGATIPDEKLRAEIIELAIKSFEALGGRNYGAVRIRMDAANTPHFIGINLLPELTNGLFSNACSTNVQMDEASLVQYIAYLALSRSEREKTKNSSVLSDYPKIMETVQSHPAFASQLDKAL